MSDLGPGWDSFSAPSAADALSIGGNQTAILELKREVPGSCGDVDRIRRISCAEFGQRWNAPRRLESFTHRFSTGRSAGL